MVCDRFLSPTKDSHQEAHFLSQTNQAFKKKKALNRLLMANNSMNQWSIDS